MSKETYMNKSIMTKNAKQINTWYVVDENGNMIIGWLKDGGNYYYLSENEETRGELVKGKITIDKKNFTFDDQNGALIEGESTYKKCNSIRHKKLCNRQRWNLENKS